MADVRPMRSGGDPQHSGIPQAPTPVKRTRALGEILVDDGFISQDQLDEARRDGEQSGKSLGRTLIDMGLVGEAALVKALATQIGLPFMDLSDFQVDVTAASLVPHSLAKRYTALPIAFEEETLIVAMSDPGNVFAVDDIRTLTGRDIRIVVATRTDIGEAIERISRVDAEVGDLAATAAAEEAETDDISDQHPPALIEMASHDSNGSALKLEQFVLELWWNPKFAKPALASCDKWYAILM